MNRAQLVAACAFKPPKAIAAYRDGWGALYGAISPLTTEDVRVVVLGMLYNDAPPYEGLRVAGEYAELLRIDQMRARSHIV